MHTQRKCIRKEGKLNYREKPIQRIGGTFLAQAWQDLWRDLADNIYGLGYRSTSQFIRGMVLRSNWILPSDDDRFVESGEHNIRIASKLGLIAQPSEYKTQLSKMAADYLDGNRGIIAHALWVIRKRYCNRKILDKPECYGCPLLNYCFERRKAESRKSLSPNFKTLILRIENG